MLRSFEIDHGLSAIAKEEFNSLGDEMREYQRRSSAGVIHPHAPYVIMLTLDKAFTFALAVGETTPLNEKVSRSLLSVAGAILRYVEKAECAIVEFDTVSVLVGEDSPHLLGDIDKINSLCSSLATATLFNEYRDSGSLPLDRPLIRCQSFAMAEASVPSYFVWRQLEAWRKCVDACLWEALGSDKEAIQEMYDVGSIEDKQDRYIQLTGKSVHQADPWYRRGMVVRRGIIRKRNKADTFWMPGRKGWVVDPTPPIFQREPDYLRQLLTEEPAVLVPAPADCLEEPTHVYFALPDKEPAMYRILSREELDDLDSTE